MWAGTLPRRGSEDKIASACRGMPGTEFLSGDHTRALITDVDAHSGASILTDEVFAGVLGVVRLPGKTVEQFLHNAVEFANDVLPGNFGAVITIDPKTRKQNAQAFDDAVAHLRYGAIGINAWTGMAFALATWGAFPGNATRHRQRHRNGTQHLHAPDTSESRRRDPVPSRAPLVAQRRAKPLAQASFLHHQQDSGNYRQTARKIPRPPQPHRTAADLPVCIARLSDADPESASTSKSMSRWICEFRCCTSLSEHSSEPTRAAALPLPNTRPVAAAEHRPARSLRCSVRPYEKRIGQ